MIEKPDLNEDLILTCLAQNFGLAGIQLEFLPLGADQNTAVYAVHGESEFEIFLKLRSGHFEITSVTLPKYLSNLGITQIIPPMATLRGELWAELDSYKVILYPYIKGQPGYEVSLPDLEWAEFGSALKKVHTAALPAAILSNIRRETYPSGGRETVSFFLGRVKGDQFPEKVAGRLATVLLKRHEIILNLVERADKLAGILQLEPRPLVLCHCDIHAGNLHITTNGPFYIVDWDDPMMAPKERDLMYIGGGLLGSWRTPAEEEALFYQGYGPAQVDPIALAYYRYERIIQDIAVYTEQILLSDNGENREQSLQYLKSNFLPGGTIEVAYNSDRTGLF